MFFGPRNHSAIPQRAGRAVRGSAWSPRSRFLAQPSLRDSATFFQRSAVAATNGHSERNGGQPFPRPRSAFERESPVRGAFAATKHGRNVVEEPLSRFFWDQFPWCVTLAKSAVTQDVQLTPLESALTKTGSRKPGGISTYKKMGRGVGAYCYPIVQWVLIGLSTAGRAQYTRRRNRTRRWACG
jgi:hypothetical protein